MKELDRIIAEATQNVILQETAKYYCNLVSERIKTKRISFDDDVQVSEDVKYYADVIMNLFFENYNDESKCRTQNLKKEAKRHGCFVLSGRKLIINKRYIILKHPIEDLEHIIFEISEYKTKKDFDCFGKSEDFTSEYILNSKTIKIKSFSILEGNNFDDIRKRLEKELSHFLIDKKNCFSTYNKENAQALYNDAIYVLQNLKDRNSDINYGIAYMLYILNDDEKSEKCERLKYELSKSFFWETFDNVEEWSNTYKNVVVAEKILNVLKTDPSRLFRTEYDASLFNNMDFETLVNYLSIRLSSVKSDYDGIVSDKLDENNGISRETNFHCNMYDFWFSDPIFLEMIP